MLEHLPNRKKYAAAFIAGDCRYISVAIQILHFFGCASIPYTDIQ